MPKPGIVTDSTACIPDELVRNLHIRVVPYYIHRENEELRDLVTIDRDSFYSWLPSAERLPTTASPGPGDYVTAYTRVFEEEGAETIASIHMTSRGSGAFQAAMAARSMISEILPKLTIEVIDTLNVSMCHGWMVIEAARAAIANRSLSEIVDSVKRMIPITRMIQTADTLKYLHMGGRIGKAKHLIGSLLNIKPLIGMDDGQISVLGTARSRKQAYNQMIDIVEKHVGEGAKIRIAYMHAAAVEEAQKIKELAERRFQIIESYICELSPALGVHTGPGTAGLCYTPVLPEN